jgi:1,4-dihydroxy-2-naphthoyl-CoA hydrolase
MSLSDLAGAVWLGLNLEEGTGWTTVESTTYFLRPVRKDEIAAAVAKPIKLGRVLVNVEIDLFDTADKHCARTSQVLQILGAS